MTFDTPVGAAIFVVALVAAVAAFAMALFRSTVALEQWLDATGASTIRDREATYLESEPRPATLDQTVDVRAA
jgi:hypothetical protein